jgi:isochorismate synthase EntC
MDKVVLARATDLHFAAPLNAGAIMAASRRSNLNCFHFLMVFNAQEAFMGSTPERLWRRRGRCCVPKRWREPLPAMRTIARRSVWVTG